MVISVPWEERNLGTIFRGNNVINRSKIRILVVLFFQESRVTSAAVCRIMQKHRNPHMPTMIISEKKCCI